MPTSPPGHPIGSPSGGRPCLVVGSLNVDLVVEVERLPGRGETVLGDTLRRGPGGKGGNQAAALGRLGANVAMVGAVGDDDLAAPAVADLQAAGVDVTHVRRRRGVSTGTALIVVDPQGENQIAVATGANARLVPADVDAALPGAGAGGVLLVGLEIPLPTALRALAAGRRAGWTTVLNPAPATRLPEVALPDVDVLVPNASEAALVHPGGAAGALAAGCGAVVVTRGDAGADVHLPGTAVGRVPAFAVTAVDTVGAGDAFCAGLVWALARGADLMDAVRSGCACGALTAATPGARRLDLSAALVQDLLASAAGHRLRGAGGRGP